MNKLERCEDIIATIIIIFFSGAVKFQNNNRFYLIILFSVLLIMYIDRKGLIFKYNITLFFSVLLVSWLLIHTLIHFLAFGKVTMPIGDLLRIMTCYIVIGIIPDVKNFIYYYNKVILFLAVTSLMIWFALNIDVTWVKEFDIVHDYAYSRYYDVHIYAVPYFAGSGTVRNNSIFWEPGAYQLFLNISIFFDLNLSEKPINLRTIIKILALITTFSTTGYAILGLIILLKYLKLKKLKGKLQYMIVGAIMFFGIFWENFVDKFSVEGGSYLSYSRRKYDIICDLNIWCNNLYSFLFGVGSEEYSKQFGRALSTYIGGANLRNASSSNGLTSLLSIYGIIGFLVVFVFYTYCIYKFKSHIDFKVIAVVLIIFIISVATENFLFSPLLILLAMYLNQYRRNTKLKDFIGSKCKQHRKSMDLRS